jgi:ubiquinone/menaquinone biosynthesis C-methylase UbiE
MVDDRDADALRSDVKQRFGERTAHYRASITHASGDDLDLLVSLVRPRAGDRALDIATGAGHVAVALARAGADVTASDLTPGMLAEAADNLAANGLHAEMAVADACALPFPDASFDIVTCRMAPHHFADADAFAHEVARVLKPGGRFGLEDQVAPEDAEAAELINAFERLRDPSHNVQRPLSEWTRLVEGAGLVVERTSIFDKHVEFEWWTSIQDCSVETRARLSAMMQIAPDAAQDWYAPAFGKGGQIFTFRIRHLVMLATRPLAG